MPADLWSTWPAGLECGSPSWETGSPRPDSGNSGAPRPRGFPYTGTLGGGRGARGSNEETPAAFEGEPAGSSGARSGSRLGMLRKPDLEAKPLGGEELCNTPFQSLAFSAVKGFLTAQFEQLAAAQSCVVRATMKSISVFFFENLGN